MGDTRQEFENVSNWSWVQTAAKVDRAAVSEEY